MHRVPIGSGPLHPLILSAVRDLSSGYTFLILIWFIRNGNLHLQRFSPSATDRHRTRCLCQNRERQ
jgi:hypothetical protein